MHRLLSVRAFEGCAQDFKVKSPWHPLHISYLVLQAVRVNQCHFAAHSEQTASSQRGCRCLLLWQWCHCKFSASMADCGDILNMSIFPECLWLIWHFSLNPSPCLCSLQLSPPSLSPFPSPSISSLTFHCSNSRLAILNTSITRLLLLACFIHRHLVSQFPP